MKAKKKMVPLVPCIGVRNSRVVKGLRLEELTDVGDPVEWAMKYEQAGADALGFLDITTMTERRKPSVELLRRMIEAVKIPIYATSNIRTVEDVELLLTSGASLVSFSSSVFSKPHLVREAVRAFGSTYIGVSFDVDFNKGMPSRREVYVSGANKRTGVDALTFARKMADAGAGVLIPTSKPCDGVRRGYDVDLIRAVADATGVPTAASGGAGALVHFVDAVRDGHAGMLWAASVFLFNTFTLQHIKMYLALNGIPIQNAPRGYIV
ncbi:MAG: imidazole glycerol phosphate synthase subunit HisF [Verrucomicrobiota bacterium]|jgi:cyclase|nr:imidazole glycerol phosphate synthase subunit HisF [Verrucomicrobiota bacterium]